MGTSSYMHGDGVHLANQDSGRLRNWVASDYSVDVLGYHNLSDGTVVPHFYTRLRENSLSDERLRLHCLMTSLCVVYVARRTTDEQDERMQRFSSHHDDSLLQEMIGACDMSTK